MTDDYYTYCLYFVFDALFTSRCRDFCGKYFLSKVDYHLPYHLPVSRFEMFESSEEVLSINIEETFRNLRHKRKFGIGSYNLEPQISLAASLGTSYNEAILGIGDFLLNDLRASNVDGFNRPEPWTPRIPLTKTSIGKIQKDLKDSSRFESGLKDFVATERKLGGFWLESLVLRRAEPVEGSLHWQPLRGKTSIPMKI